MEAEMNKKYSQFGIEVEFYILDPKDYPALNSNQFIKEKCLEIDPKLSIVQELSSFQIEINPGPWPLTESGLKQCLIDLQHHYKILGEVVQKQNLKLCNTLMPANLTQDIIYNSDFFTKNTRYKASSNYFKQRKDIVLQNETSMMRFPGEAIIGCINEVHIHAQMTNDLQTIRLFNYLNTKGLGLTKCYNQEIKINGHRFSNFDSIELFTLANGEWNSDKTQYRVGNLNGNIANYEDYESILKSFNKIPFDNQSFLDLESTVYFWTRLRGKPENLRVEFRPMEMGEDWIERVKYLYQIIKDFEENATTDCQAHLQFAQANAQTKNCKRACQADTVKKKQRNANRVDG